MIDKILVNMIIIFMCILLGLFIYVWILEGIEIYQDYKKINKGSNFEREE